MFGTFASDYMIKCISDKLDHEQCCIQKNSVLQVYQLIYPYCETVILTYVGAVLGDNSVYLKQFIFFKC